MKQVDYIAYIQTQLQKTHKSEPAIVFESLLQKFNYEANTWSNWGRSQFSKGIEHGRLCTDLIKSLSKTTPNNHQSVNQEHSLAAAFKTLQSYKEELKPQQDFTALLNAFFSFYPKEYAKIERDDFKAVIKPDFTWIDRQFRTQLTTAVAIAKQVDFKDYMEVETYNPFRTEADRQESEKQRQKKLNIAVSFGFLFQSTTLLAKQDRPEVLSLLVKKAEQDHEHWLSLAAMMPTASSDEKEMLIKQYMQTIHSYNPGSYYPPHTIVPMITAASKTQAMEMKKELFQMADSTSPYLSVKVLEALNTAHIDEALEKEILLWALNKFNHPDLSALSQGLIAASRASLSEQEAKQLPQYFSFPGIMNLLNSVEYTSVIAKMLSMTPLVQQHQIVQTLLDNELFNANKTKRQRIIQVLGHYFHLSSEALKNRMMHHIQPLLEDEKIVTQLFSTSTVPVTGKSVDDQLEHFRIPRFESLLTDAMIVASKEQKQTMARSLLRLSNQDDSKALWPLTYALEDVSHHLQIAITEKMLAIVKRTPDQFPHNNPANVYSDAARGLGVAAIYVPEKRQEIIDILMKMKPPQCQVPASELATLLATTSLPPAQFDRIYQYLLRLATNDAVETNVNMTQVLPFMLLARISSAPRTSLLMGVNDDMGRGVFGSFPITVSNQFSGLSKEDQAEKVRWTIQELLSLSHYKSNHGFYHICMGRKLLSGLVSLFNFASHEQKQLIVKRLLDLLGTNVHQHFTRDICNSIKTIATQLDTEDQVALLRDVMARPRQDQFPDLLPYLMQLSITNISNITKRMIAHILQATAPATFTPDIAALVNRY